MSHRAALRRAPAILVAAGLLFLSACAVPLGPGYAIEQEQLQVRFVPDSPPRLAVRAAYRMKNTGDQPLAFLEMELPHARTYGRQNLRVEVDGRETAPQAAVEAEDGKWRIPIDPPWKQKQRRELVIAYELTAETFGNDRMVLHPDAFLLQPGGWYPALLPPTGTFATGGERADPTWLSISVPPSFLAHASGRLAGKKTGEAETQYRFRLGADDFDPFVVAGRYREEQVRTPDATVVFWTLRQVPSDGIRAAGERIAATVKAYESMFGPRDKKQHPVWVIDCPIKGGSYGASAAGRGSSARGSCPSLPGVAMPERVESLSPATEPAFLDQVDHQLARTWFGFMLSPDSETQPLPMAAAPDYAVIAAEESFAGEQAHRKAVLKLLTIYDAARPEGPAKPLPLIGSADPPWLQARGYAGSTLFFLALEDECGREHVHRALARIIRALRGKAWGVEELRSALEAETGKDLAEFFRLWLSREQIPAEFRARYEAGVPSRQ